MSQKIWKSSEKKLTKKKYKRGYEMETELSKADSKYTGGDKERKVKIRKNSLVGLFIFHD